MGACSTKSSTSAASPAKGRGAAPAPAVKYDPDQCVNAPDDTEKLEIPSVASLGDPFTNIVMLTDSYKVTHHLQYPPGTQTVYSYFECRGGDFEEICFFGLQYFLKRYLTGQVVTKEKIEEAETYMKSHFYNPDYGYQENLFNKAGWQYIVDQKGGKLPVAIKSVPEGTVVPFKNVLFTLENTDDKCYWLTNYLETLLVQVWYPTTVCTQSREQKKIIQRYLKDTGCTDEHAYLFKLHDFGFRGVSSVESAGIGGAGHLVNFLGTDTMAALVVLKEYYGEGAGGFSIPASEHSTITSWGKDHEKDAMENMLDKYPKGIIACVSDSYDIFNACEKLWGTDLKAKIESRQGTLVVRPDSGELPITVIQVLDKLGANFAPSTNSAGFKVLPEQIRVIQGDGIDIKSLETIFWAMKQNKWAAENLAFGSGGALLQKLHRDTSKCAFKCCYAVIGDKGVDIQKDPITDPGKKSKKGKLTLQHDVDTDTWTTVEEGKGVPEQDQLVEVFRDGKLKVDDPFDAIKKRSCGQVVNPHVKTSAMPDWIPKQLWKPVKNLFKEAAHLADFSSQSVDEDPLHNIVMLSDSYKVTHHLQYPPGTETVYSYFECRGDGTRETVFFGLQYFLKRYMTGKVVTPEKINRAEEYFKTHFAHPVYGYQADLFNKPAWEYIAGTKEGRLPISVRAVAEGTVLTDSNVLFTLENTDPMCYWLTNYLETLLVQVWYPITVCTQSRDQKKIIKRYLTETGCDDALSKGGHLFKLHDFGFRGVSSVESAATGGCAHLVNFLGSDTMAALVCAKECYNEDNPGFSIPASEHSTITSWGKEKEVDAMKNMLEMYPKGVVACVSDSYNIWVACENHWGETLKELIDKRNGTLVVRPDSGELPKTVLDVLEKLGGKFGTEKTRTGHKLLPKQIRVIQGDGIDPATLEVILEEMKKKSWAADNLAFGSGGALLQKLHRDTLKCAFKCSHVVVKGEGQDVFKDPITDKGKQSKKGKLKLCRDKRAGQWVTATQGQGKPEEDWMVEVFRDGQLLVDRSMVSIRQRSEVGVNEFPPTAEKKGVAPPAGS